MAQHVLDDAGYTGLALALARTENQSKNPAKTLAEAAALRELDTADSIADVLRHRIELQHPAQDTETDAPLPWLTDPALVSNCDSSWHTYIDSCAHGIRARLTEISDQSEYDFSADQQLLEAAYREQLGATDAESRRTLAQPPGVTRQPAARDLAAQRPGQLCPTPGGHLGDSSPHIERVLPT